MIDTDRNLWDPLKTPERRLPTLPQITPSFTTSSIQIVGEPQPAPTPSPSFAKSTIQIDGDAPASPKQERFVDLSGSDGEGEEAPIPAEAPLPSWLEESEESGEEAKEAGVVKSVDCCVVEDAATSAKREWSEKHKEIEEKRRRMEAEQPEEEEKHQGAGSFLVDSAVRYMREHYQEKLTLQEVADRCYVSQWHLSKLLNKYMEMSFYDILNSIRIENAKRLLENPGLKIGQIGEMVGYADAAHFTRTFKKLEGINANEYRNRMRNMS